MILAQIASRAKFSKIFKILKFSIFLRFLKILMILLAEFHLSYRAVGMELEGAITTVGKDFVHTLYVHTSGTQYVHISDTCVFCVPDVYNSKFDFRISK